jgi:Leucine-rich repeat (LRR) protein
VVLNLSGNSLSSLPPDFGTNLPALQQLYLNSNLLTDLPPSLASAPLLELYLADNPLGAVPRVVTACKGLRQLSLAVTGLSKLPAALGHLTQLRYACVCVTGILQGCFPLLCTSRACMVVLPPSLCGIAMDL